MIKTKSGFTLAEVLTTLMVIGVVAAMTIPTLMNSTGEQQARVACKKAASILSQGVQLLIAKEEECAEITDNETLALCMNNVITGTRTGNTIQAPDGMVYAFYIPAGAKGKDGEGKAVTANLETTCGAVAAQANGGNNCGVIVDTNGYSKGVKSSLEDKTGQTFFSNAGFDATVENGSDRVAFALFSTGVKPVAISGAMNNAWKYMYGKSATDSDYTTKLCCTGKALADIPDCSTGKNSGKKICTPTATASNTCPDGTVDVTSLGTVTQGQCF